MSNDFFTNNMDINRMRRVMMRALATPKKVKPIVPPPNIDVKYITAGCSAGKTKYTCELIGAKEYEHPILIIAPPNVVKSKGWMVEADKWVPGLSKNFINLSIGCTNRLPKIGKISGVVIDEASAFEGMSQRTKNLRKFLRARLPGFVYFVSATPSFRLDRSLYVVYCLLNFATKANMSACDLLRMRDTLGNPYARSVPCMPVGTYSLTPIGEAFFRNNINEYLVRVAEPPVLPISFDVVFESRDDELDMEIANEELGTCGSMGLASLMFHGRLGMWTSKKRLARIAEELKDPSPLVIVCGSIELRALIKDLCLSKGKTVSILYAKDAEKVIASWLAGKLDVLIMLPVSSSFGLNLQGGGHRMLWTQVPLSAEMFIQLSYRLYRRGQEKDCQTKVLCSLGDSVKRGRSVFSECNSLFRLLHKDFASLSPQLQKMKIRLDMLDSLDNLNNRWVIYADKKCADRSFLKKVLHI